MHYVLCTLNGNFQCATYAVHGTVGEVNFSSDPFHRKQFSPAQWHCYQQSSPVGKDIPCHPWYRLRENTSSSGSCL